MERTNAAGLNNVAERLKELHTCVDRIEQRIEANMHGDQARPGIVVRVDRLEQAHERSRWLFRLIIGAVITLSVGAVFALLKS